MRYDPFDGFMKMFELGARTAAMKEQKVSVRKKKKPEDDEIDLLTMYIRHKEKAEKYKKALEEIAKLEKKDDKKDDKKKPDGLSTLQLAMLFFASFPISAPLYVMWLRYLGLW